MLSENSGATCQLSDPRHVSNSFFPLKLGTADLLIANGAFPSPFPNIVGHEGSGKVVKVGKAVTRVKEGDSVLLSFSYDQKCKICKAGHPAACKVGNTSNALSRPLVTPLFRLSEYLLTFICLCTYPDMDRIKLWKTTPGRI